MKKVLSIIMAAIAIFGLTACENDNKGTETVPPVSNVFVPASAKIGSTMSVRGEGFESYAKLYFIAADGKETPIENISYGNTGVSFKVPVQLIPGTYKLSLEQGGKWILGEVSLTEATHNIQGLTFPKYAGTGLECHISGIGFTPSSVIKLVSAGGASTELKTVFSTQGLTVSIPSSLSQGNYSVVLSDSSNEYVLNNSFKIYKVKKLESIEQIIDQSGFKMTGKWYYKSDNTLYYYNDMVGGEYGFNVAKTTDGYDFTLQNPSGLEIMAFDFKIKSENNHVKNIEVDENGSPLTYSYNYTPEGYLLSTTGDFGYDFSYDKDGNLIAINGDMNHNFTYSDKGKGKINPYCMHIGYSVLCTDSMYMYEDSMKLAIIMGLIGSHNTNLPDTISGYDLQCEYDNEGYIKSAKWTETESEMLITINLSYK